VTLLSEQPASHPGHLLGCHHPRISDRTVVDKIPELLQFGCSYLAIADTSCSATTIRSRRDEWIRLDVFAGLKQITPESYDRIAGLVLEQIAVDGTVTKAPGAPDAAGRSPVDRGKQDLERQGMTGCYGIPLGRVPAEANGHDCPLLARTLDRLDSLGTAARRRHCAPECRLRLGGVRPPTGVRFPVCGAGDVRVTQAAWAYSVVASVPAHGAWQRLTPVAQRREEKLAGERAYFVPRRIGGQGVAPEVGAAGGIDPAEATADGLKIAQILGFKGSTLRQSFGDAAEELHLFDDGLRPQLTLAHPGKLILGLGCEECHKSQRPRAQVRVAEMVHTCRMAPDYRQTVFADPSDARRTRVSVTEHASQAIARQARRRIGDALGSARSDPAQARRVTALLDELAQMLL
jgi:hypothetical protein